METLQSASGAPPTLTVDFSWSPTGPPLTVTVGDTIYSNGSVDPLTRIDPPEFSTPVNTELTFEADIGLPEAITIIEYRWAFGDGTGGYGPSVDHTYRVPSPQTRCVLTVLDSTGRVSYAAHQMNLRPADLIRIDDGVIHVEDV